MVSLSDPKCQITKLKAMAIAPKVTGIISLISSTFIIQHVLRDRKRRNLTYHRLLLGMSISDFFGSLMCFLSTWPIPRGEACLAAGTTATCTAQGFFNQTAALCTPTYNISLAVYYILVIVKGRKESRVSKIEKYLHALPILAGFGTGFAALGLKLYNGAGWICWIAPAPNNPERNDPNYGIYRLAFLYADAWAIIVFLAVCMCIIYFHVLKQEKKLDKYRASYSQKKRKQSKKIRNQAFLYVGCMYMTWIFGSAFRFMQFAGKTPPTSIIVLFVTFFPLQGFFNLTVYMFPRILRYFEEGVPLTQSFRRTSSLFSSIRSVAKKRQSQTQAETQVSCVEGVAETNENGAILEEDVDDADKEAEEHGIEDTTNAIEEGDPGDEDGTGDAPKDAIDELEYIVEA
ncbi:hypothetical protein ACHAWT_000741 [Skeletonema menzelii]